MIPDPTPDPTPEIPDREHEYRVGSTTPAKRDVDGQVRYKCTICEHTYTEVIKATGHSYELTKKQGSNYIYTCDICGKTLKQKTPLSVS